MSKEAWKDYWLSDRETENAFASSEVFQIFARDEARRDAEKSDLFKLAEEELDDELRAEAELEKFKKRVASSPLLRARLLLAKRALEENPSLLTKTDPTFVRGLELLDLDEVDE